MASRAAAGSSRCRHRSAAEHQLLAAAWQQVLPSTCPDRRPSLPGPAPCPAASALAVDGQEFQGAKLRVEAASAAKAAADALVAAPVSALAGWLGGWRLMLPHAPTRAGACAVPGC